MNKQKDFNSQVFNEVATYDGLDNDDSRELSYPFPRCNHIAGVTEYNAGYTRGFLNYDIPFEAEIFANDNSEIWLAVVMPAAFKEEEKTLNLVQCDEYECEWNRSVLTKNMRSLGRCEDYQLEYNEMLIQNDIFTMNSCKVPGYVKYYMDDENNIMVQVFIGMMDVEGALHYTDLEIIDF